MAERDLAMAVIVCTIDDITAYRNSMGKSHRNGLRNTAMDAMWCLFTQNNSMALWCHLAEVNINVLRQKIKDACPRVWNEYIGGIHVNQMS